MRTLAALAALSLLTACASPASPAGDAPALSATLWQSELHVGHALTGKIWDVQANAAISQEELLAALGQARIVILGEKHDNPDHHALQRSVLTALRNAGVLSGVSFEMLDTRQQPALDFLARVDLTSEEAVRAHLQWDADGWDWSLYGPLVLDVARAGLPIRAANISTDEMMAVYGAPLAAEVAGALSQPQIERLYTEIDESHCGMLPESQFPAMVRVQQARDASMARSLVGANAGVQVLIAGNFHARRDLGVTNYLPPGLAGVLSVGILEVNPEEQTPLAYLQAFSDVLPYDYLWFTPAVSAEDYCASLREGRQQTAFSGSANRSGN